jgi:hypothetical protein
MAHPTPFTVCSSSSLEAEQLRHEAEHLRLIMHSYLITIIHNYTFIMLTLGYTYMFCFLTGHHQEGLLILKYVCVA